MMDEIWAKLVCEHMDWLSQPMTIREIATMLANNQTDRAEGDKSCPGPHFVVEVGRGSWDFSHTGQGVAS
jgi:hypothetical protein